MAQQLEIVGKAQVEISELQAKARKILEQSKLTFEKEKTQLELMRMRKLKELEIKKAKENLLAKARGNKLLREKAQASKNTSGGSCGC